MDNILEVKNLCKKYDNFELKNISFSLPKGMIMGLIGENGAGKTTTIKAILNIIKADKGVISVFNLDNKLGDEKIKEDIGVVLDDMFFPEILTANDINKIMKNIYANWDSKMYYDFLKENNLDVDMPIKSFSKGMHKKLEIITALAHHPKLLILDEPTSGLDPIARKDILNIFQTFIQNEECSILLSSHITTDLEHLADYITFINNGELVLTKTCDELLENYGIVKCSREDFKNIDANDYLKYINNKYSYDVLIDNVYDFKKKYPNYLIDKITLEDLMFLMIKGVK